MKIMITNTSARPMCETSTFFFLLSLHLVLPPYQKAGYATDEPLQKKIVSPLRSLPPNPKLLPARLIETSGTSDYRCEMFLGFPGIGVLRFSILCSRIWCSSMDPNRSYPWVRRPHQDAKRLISACILCTPLSYLPFLSGIQLPQRDTCHVRLLSHTS